MRRALFFLLFSLLFLEKEVEAQRLPFVVYNTRDGLVHNRCHTVRQDGLGYMWIGTDIGIARFDGRAFTYYPSPDEPFSSATSAMVENGWVVFGQSNLGIVRCRGDVVQRIKTKGQRFGFCVGIAPALEGGYLFSDVGRGIFRIAPDGTATRADSALPFYQSRFLDMLRDSRGGLWLGSTAGLLYASSGYLRDARPVPHFDSFYVNVIREAPDGTMYVGWWNGVSRFPKPAPGVALAAIQPQRLYSKAHPTGIAFAEGVVWCSSAFDAVVRITGPMQYTTYAANAGLPAPATWDVYRDREGTLWFATENGLVKLVNSGVSLVDFSTHTHPLVRHAMAWGKDGFIFSNGDTLYRWEGAHYRALAGLTGNAAFGSHRLFTPPDGGLWRTRTLEPKPSVQEHQTVRAAFDGQHLGQEKPLSEFPGGPREVFFNSGAFADGPDLWCRTSDGFMHYRDGVFEKAELAGVNGRRTRVDAICAGIKPGEAWVLDSGTYLIRCAVRRDETGHARLDTAERVPAAMLRGRMFQIMHVHRSGRIFLGGRQGLAMASSRGRGYGWVCAHYGIAGGQTSSEWITSFAEDSTGTMWIGTAAGLDKCSFSAHDTRIERGLFRSELCGAFIYFVRAVGNRLFVGTTGCMGVVELNRKSSPAPSPLIHLTGLRIGSETADSLLQSQESVRLRSHQNYLSFSFLGISFANEQAIRYRYRLDGLEETWNGLTPEARVTYSSIPPGRYTFLVEAQNAAGVWSERPAKFSFSILAPFYTRWWFILLSVQVTAAILYGFYRYRLAQVLAIQRIRTKISKDLHDDIGATVSSIGILASIAGKNGLKEEKRYQYLDIISDQSKYVAETLSDIVWAINPSNDTLEGLFARVLRYATELFEARGIEYTIDASPDALRGLSLPMDARQNLYLLIKEAVNNLVKYSGAAHATIRVAREAGYLAVSIADDGRGFDPATTTGNGLQNMRKRAEALHGVLRIISQRGGGGARVELDIPLKTGARMM